MILFLRVPILGEQYLFRWWLVDFSDGNTDIDKITEAIQLTLLAFHSLLRDVRILFEIRYYVLI